MKRTRLISISLVSALAMPGNAFALADVVPTVPGQIGTSQVQRGLDVFGQPLFEKRVGVIAYCADIAENIAPSGLFGEVLFNSDPIGLLGARNIVDMIRYDDSIPRFRDVVLIDGDRELPTAQQLIQNFDCVIAYTDNKCGVPIPLGIANSAANALTGFANAGKGVVLTGFAFNTQIGFGDAIFAGGLSPFRKNSPAVDPRCSPPDPTGVDPTRSACPIGTCPSNATRQFPAEGIVSAPECFVCAAPCSNVTDPVTRLPFCAVDPTQVPVNTAANFCGQFIDTIFQPLTTTPDRVCQSLMKRVQGPTSATFANAFPANPVRPNATLCGQYNNGLPLLAVNQSRNVVGLNLFPAYAPDLQKVWFSCILANAAILACGERRCRPSDGGVCNTGFCAEFGVPGSCDTCCDRP